jgi:pimeloyl-ACP methyl ester carboxylesterase
VAEPFDARPRILLLPGLDGTGRLYYRQVDRLAERYRATPWRYAGAETAGYPELIAQLEDATSMEPPGSVLVVGESFGGTVALHFALAYPERIRLLALVNTFPVYRRRMRIRLACRLSPFLDWSSARRFKESIVERTLALEGIAPEDRARYREIIATVDRVGYRRRLELVRDVNLSARLPELRMPTLIFASGRDKIVPSMAESRFMAARIPNARLHEFPRAGHALLLTPGFWLADYL